MSGQRVFFARWSNNLGPVDSEDRFATWGPAAKQAGKFRRVGVKASVYVRDDDGIRLFREWRRGAWREPSKKPMAAFRAWQTRRAKGKG